MRESPTSWKCCIMMSAIGNGAPLSLPSRCMWPTSFMPPTRAKPGSSLVGTNLSFATAFAYPATSNAYHLHCIHNRTNSRAKPAMASCISSNSIVRPPPQCLYIRGSTAPSDVRNCCVSSACTQRIGKSIAQHRNPSFPSVDMEL